MKKKIIIIIPVICILLYGGLILFVKNKASDPVLNAGQVQKSWLGVSDDDFKKENMTRKIQASEDGLRTSMKPGIYEWWYYDAHFTNGMKVVIVYLTKDFYAPGSGPRPMVTISIKDKNGKDYKEKIELSYDKNVSFSKKQCDVKIGKNFCKGDLNEYKIFAHIKGLKVDLTLKRTVPSWRPGNGHLYFGTKGKYFAWLPAVPEGNIKGTITIDKKTHNVTGSGYHDHNWGNVSIATLLKKWWWARVSTDKYTAIAVMMYSRNEYGAQNHPVFMVADKNSILADGSLKGASTSLKLNDFRIHSDKMSKEKIAYKLDYEYKHKGNSVSISFLNKELLKSSDLLKSQGPVKGHLASMAGLTPWYTRFKSDIIMTIKGSGKNITVKGHAIQEKMDFQ